MPSARYKSREYEEICKEVTNTPESKSQKAAEGKVVSYP